MITKITKMRVLFITNTFPLNENIERGKFNYDAAVQLSSVCDLKVIHLRSWRPWRKIVEIKRIKRIEFTTFSFPYYSTSFVDLDAFQLWVYKHIFRFILGSKLKHYNVVHSVGAGFSAIIGSSLSYKYNIPHIAQCIGTDVNYTLPRIKNCLGVKGMEENVNYFTCNSFELEKQVQKLYPEAKTTTIYRGVDLNFFNLNSSIINKKDKIIFTYLGGLSLRKETGKNRDYKGGETLLRAWSKLEKYDNKELNFAGPEVTESLVNKLLGGKCQDYNVNIDGILNKEEVSNLLHISDIVIIPSWAEGLPNVGMEAMASSCALLGTNVGGIPELIDNNGYLFEPGNIDELISLIEQFCSNGILLHNMKKKSRQIAESKFDSKQFVNQYLELYEKL